METKQCTPSPEESLAQRTSSAGQQLFSQGANSARLSNSHRSPLRLFIIMILAIFLAEVVAMIVVYFIEPLPYHLTTLLDAGVMTVLIFPVLYYFSFRPLLRQMEKSQQAEEALGQLSRIVEQTEDNVVVTNREGVIEYVNPAFERLTGYTSVEVLGQTPTLLKSGLHDRDFYAELWNTILRGDVFQAEIANRKKSGALFYEVKTITPLRDPEGNITHFVATGKDVTTNKRDEEELRKAYEESEIRVAERTEELHLANRDLKAEINTRKQTEEAHQRSEAGLKRAQEIAHLGNWELDLVTDQLTWSDEVYRIFGLKPQEFRASYEAFLEVVHPDDRAAVDDAYSSSVAAGQDGYEIEHRIIRRSTGEIRTVHEKCEHFRDETGQVVRSIGMVHDITERKQAEEQLQYQAALLSNVNDAIVAADSQFRITAWNASAELLYGWKAEEVLGINGLEIVRTEWPEGDPQQMRRAIAEAGRWRGEATQIRKDGTRFPVEISSMVLHDEKGETTGYISVNRDITARKQAEKELERFRLLAEHTRDIILFMRREDGQILDANTAAIQGYGYSREELLGLMIRDLRADHLINLRADQMAQADADGVLFESVHRCKDGREFPVEVSSQGATIGGVPTLVSIVRDITERREAEEALRESAAKYRNLFENMTEEVHFWQLVRDESGHIKTWQLVDANPPALKSWNRKTVDEIQGKTTDEIFGPGSTEHYMPVVQKITTDGLPHSFEDYFAHLDKHFRFTSVPLGEYFITTGADITTIKKAETALREARDELELRVQQRTAELATSNRELVREIAERKDVERQLRIQTKAMEAAANGIVITDRQGTIQWTNPALVQISGYEIPALMGQKMQIFNSGRHDPDYYRQMWNTILSGQVWRGEITNRRKDGSFYVEEQTITPVRDEQGQITQFISIKQDITERKQAEAALRESEEKFRTLVEWIYDWEVWLDPDGHIVYNSPACERITGYSPEEFRSTPDFILRILHPDDLVLYQDHRRLVHRETAGAETIEYRIVTRDGRERWIQHVCRPLFDADNRYLGRRISNRDITERREAERDLQARNQKEKILTATIHTLQLDIARDLHDTIGQNISFLRMKLDHLAERQVRKRAEMQAEIQSLAQVANESYDLMRGTLGVLQSENSSDLFRLFSRYAEQIEERSAFKIEFCLLGEPRFISAKRMRQLFYVFREILNNIEKHSNASKLSIRMSWDEEGLNLAVMDNGCGFDMDSVQYVGHYGLRFMRERVELLNGSILIRSAIGSGTEILVQVPYE